MDPVTGQKLTEAQRLTAGAMAAAGFIPVFGWAGRALKGGNALFKTVKGVNAASHTLDAYKATTALSKLQLTEMGIYGLVAVDGLTESVTGKDMFGNELTDDQRQQSLFQALGIVAVGRAARYVDRVQTKNASFRYRAKDKKEVNINSEQASNISMGEKNSPSEIAQSWQGNDRYPGIDMYRDIQLKEGKVIYRGEPYGSEYFTTKSGKTGKWKIDLIGLLAFEREAPSDYRLEYFSSLENRSSIVCKKC